MAFDARNPQAQGFASPNRSFAKLRPGCSISPPSAAQAQKSLFRLEILKIRLAASIVRLLADRIAERQRGFAMVFYILIAAAVAAIAGFIWIYNLLVSRWQMVNNGWADVDVQLKRRSDLIPRLVDVVGGYASHERNLFEDIAEKRALAESAGEDPARRAEAENALAKPVAQLLALAEAYPDLKASGNFSGLSKELVETENRIEMARRFYNGAVRELNTAAQSFPTSLVARVIGFSQRSYFEIESAERAAPQVRLATP